jgi:hypothetical protein
MVTCVSKLSQSDIVRVDTTKEPAEIIGRVQGVGKKAHGLVKWHGAYILLDSDNGALSTVRLGAGGAKVTRLWKAPEPNRWVGGSWRLSGDSCCVAPASGAAPAGLLCGLPSMLQSWTSR